MIGNKYKSRKLEFEDLEIALNHISDYWKTLRRSSTKDNNTLIALPHPYVVPSPGNDHFKFEEQYYWDSFFTSLGIDDEELVEGMLDNLIYLFNTFGVIPNANRYYFMSRSQPPLLTTYIFYVYDTYGKSKEWLKERIAVAKKEYKTVWINTDHPHARNVYKGLSRYYDINHLHDLAEAESGWDMTPRFKRQCLDYLPIDLNCLLYKYEMDFARAAELLGDGAEEKIWHYTAKERQTAVTALMWNKRKNFFFDYNYIEKKQGSVWSLAAYYALWSGLATKEQAAKLVDQLDKFEKNGGLATTSGAFMYAPLFGSTKTQWAYPNGWAPLHYIVVEGLEKYHYSMDAERVALKWLSTGNKWFMHNGEFLEKYNVVHPHLRPYEGLYPSQTGFGWTNSVFAYLAKKYVSKPF